MIFSCLDIKVKQGKTSASQRKHKHCHCHSDCRKSYFLCKIRDCKIIFLARQFKASYKSRFPDRGNKAWVAQNYSREVDLEEFCNNWTSQVSFALSLKEHKNCKLVNYENLFHTNAMKIKKKALDDLMEWLGVSEPNWDKCSELISCTDKRKGVKHYNICEVDWKTIIRKHALLIDSLNKQLGYDNTFNQKEPVT